MFYALRWENGHYALYFVPWDTDMSMGIKWNEGFLYDYEVTMGNTQQRFDYPALDETAYRETLPNGLRVVVVPQKGFAKKLAYFATDFGSIHTAFRLGGQEYTVPAGVAHYLEH